MLHIDITVKVIAVRYCATRVITMQWTIASAINCDCRKSVINKYSITTMRRSEATTTKAFKDHVMHSVVSKIQVKSNLSGEIRTTLQTRIDVWSKGCLTSKRNTDAGPHMFAKCWGQKGPKRNLDTDAVFLIAWCWRNKGLAIHESDGLFMYLLF